MEILNINKDSGVTRIQAAGGIVFVKELWMENKERREVRLTEKYEADSEAIRNGVIAGEYICVI
jgi:hypothetical protein